MLTILIVGHRCCCARLFGGGVAVLLRHCRRGQ